MLPVQPRLFGVILGNRNQNYAKTIRWTTASVWTTRAFTEACTDWNVEPFRRRIETIATHRQDEPPLKPRKTDIRGLAHRWFRWHNLSMRRIEHNSCSANCTWRIEKANQADLHGLDYSARRNSFLFRSSDRNEGTGRIYDTSTASLMGHRHSC